MDVAGCRTYLPPEVLGCLVDQVDNISTLHALTCASWLLNTLATAPLYRLALEADDVFNVEHHHGSISHAPVPDDLHTPLPLWAASRDPALALPLLERIAKAQPDAPWKTYWQRGDSCWTHWGWSREHLAVGIGRRAAIHIAARAGNTPVVDWLLDHARKEVDIDILSYRGCVCSSSHMRFLVAEHGLSCPWDSPAATALHLALGAGQAETAKHLISNGADWTRPVKDAHGVTGLMIMASNGMLDLVDWIQSQPFNDMDSSRSAVDQLDDMGFRAINYLAVAPDAITTRLLTRRFATWNLGSDVYFEPCEATFPRDWDEIEDNASDPENKPFNSAIKFNNRAMMEEIISVEDKGVDVCWRRRGNLG